VESRGGEVGGEEEDNVGAFFCPKLNPLSQISNTYFRDPSSNMIQTSNILKSDISNLKSRVSRGRV